MPVSPQNLISRADNSNRLQRILQFPLIRIVIAMVFLGPSVIVFNLVFGRLIETEVRWTSWPGDLAAIFVVGLTIWGYRLYSRLVERRPAFEVQSSGCVVETAPDFSMSSVFVIVTILAIALIGSYRVSSTNPASTLVHGFFIFGMPNSSVTVLPSLIVPEIVGPTWLTGGGFGIEMSLIGVTLNVLAGVVLMKLAMDRRHVLGPFWPRRHPPHKPGS